MLADEGRIRHAEDAARPVSLIVTAELPRTADSFQFEGEAVCIPIVSSTGHGHASLKRVHYARGKFAVANLLVVAQPYPEAPVDAKWLWLYLDHHKDDLIVPLMRGTANVSLKPAQLADIPIDLPPVIEQRRIVDLIEAVDVVIEAASAVRRQSSVLWHSWAEDVWAAEDAEVQLGAIGRATTGSTPSTTKPEYWHPDEVPFFGPGDIGDEPILTESRRYVSRAGADAVRPILAPAVAQVCVGFGTGKVAVVGVPGCTNQQINTLTGLDQVDAITAMAMLRSASGQARLKSIRGLTVTPVVKKSAWAAMRIRWPGREARAMLCGVVTDAADVADRAGRAVEALTVLRSALLGGLLEGSHRIPASYDHFVGDAA